MNYLEEYKKWCESPEFDEETKQELLAIKGNEKEIEDRFYQYGRKSNARFRQLYCGARNTR